MVARFNMTTMPGTPYRDSPLCTNLTQLQKATRKLPSHIRDTLHQRSRRVLATTNAQTAYGCTFSHIRPMI